MSTTPNHGLYCSRCGNTQFRVDCKCTVCGKHKEQAERGGTPTPPATKGN